MLLRGFLRINQQWRGLRPRGAAGQIRLHSVFLAGDGKYAPALSLRTSDRRHWCGNPFSVSTQGRGLCPRGAAGQIRLHSLFPRGGSGKEIKESPSF